MFAFEVVRVCVWSSGPCVHMCVCKRIPVGVHVRVNICGSLSAGGRTWVRVYVGLFVGACERLCVCVVACMSMQWRVCLREHACVCDCALCGRV